MTHIDHSKYKIYNEFLHWHNSCPVYKKIFQSRVPEPLLPTDIHIIRNASNEAENDIKNIKEELYNSENVAFLSLLWFGELLWKPLDCFLSLKNKHTHTHPGTGSKPIGPVTQWKCWGRHCFYLSWRSQASQSDWSPVSHNKLFARQTISFQLYENKWDPMPGRIPSFWFGPQKQLLCDTAHVERRSAFWLILHLICADIFKTYITKRPNI